jgi:DNA replication protein DnaC
VSELVTTRIRATAAKPGLPHLAETLTDHLQRADAGQMGYLDLPGLILEEELAVREERRLRHALRTSKMPHHKTLDEYDFSYQPDLDPRKVRDLATLAFAGAKANAALLGPPSHG